MSLGTGDLVAALSELHERYACVRSSATYRLADGALLTLALDESRELTITRRAGDGETSTMSVPVPTSLGGRA